MNKLIKKIITLFCLLTFLAAPLSALAWGSATHAYFADKLGNKFGYFNWQEIYGSVLPDFVNLALGAPYQPFLFDQTHYQFMKLVNLAKFGSKKAVAYGFASHNEDWGADFVAHKDYILAKNAILAPILKPKIKDFFDANGIPCPDPLLDQLALDFAENANETAIDLLISQNQNKLIGTQMVLAAQLQAASPFLLVSAYAGDLAAASGLPYWQAASLIFKTEREFRDYIKTYGRILSQENRVDLLAELGAELAETKLANQYDILVEVPASLMKESLLAGVANVVGDYGAKLSWTTAYLGQVLRDHNIETWSY